ncbi:hypothetical protein GCM10010191_18580 [Actinomadura vinacea]|uniref:Lasso peptide biosynthesis PqqD family chaperone n=2 Tax=Actinomadura vinacea TaxID=115336 RepID=A0ABN3IR26_9ACTN
MVLLNERTGRYWSLNQTGRAVLLSLMDGRGPEDAVEDLARRYPSFADRIAQDVEALVRSLLEEKVVLP